MEHHEFLFLLHRAHLLRKYIEGAEKDGEVFHVAEHFSPLEAGIEAEAQIRKIHPTDPGPVLILRLRYRPALVDGPTKVLTAAHVFFSGKYTACGELEARGWIECVFFSHDVLRPVTLVDDDAATDPQPAAPASTPSAPR